MGSLWQRHLEGLRDQFRAMRKQDAPVFSSMVQVVEYGAFATSVTEPPHTSIPPAMRKFGFSLPVDSPRPCAIEDWVVWIPRDRQSFRDKSGKLWAVLSYPTRILFSTYCDNSAHVQSFNSPAADAISAMLGTPKEIFSAFPPSIHEFCRPIPTVTRFRFGIIDDEPTKSIASKSAYGMAIGNCGVLVDWITREKYWPNAGSYKWVRIPSAAYLETFTILIPEFRRRNDIFLGCGLLQKERGRPSAGDV